MPDTASFFADPPDRPLPDPDDTLSWITAGPVWAGPPWHTRPGIAAMSVEMGRSGTTVVVLEGARAYPDGLVLRLVVHVSETGQEARRRLRSRLEVAHGRGGLQARLMPGGLRWGVEFADSRRVTTLAESPWVAGPPPGSTADWLPEHPVLAGFGDPSGREGLWSRNAWLWPMPPPGRLRVVCAWGDRDIAETSTYVEVAPLRDAALRSEVLWTVPAARPGTGQGWPPPAHPSTSRGQGEVRV